MLITKKAGILALLLGMIFSTYSLSQMIFSERLEYSRYSLPYYLLAPSVFKAMPNIADAADTKYYYSVSDGPKPTIHSVVYASVKDLGDSAKKIESHLVSQGIHIDTGEKAAGDILASIEVSTGATKKNEGTIRIDIFEY